MTIFIHDGRRILLKSDLIINLNLEDFLVFYSTVNREVYITFHSKETLKKGNKKVVLG